MSNEKNFERLIDRPGHLIRRLHQVHVALFLEECGEQNLTPVQFGVLTVLKDGKERDQVTIASSIGIDRNTAADVISRLEKRRLLVRPNNPSDRRTKLAKITARGQAIVDTVVPGMIEAQKRLVAPLSNEEYETFMSLTLKLVTENDHNNRVPWRNDNEHP